MTVPGNLVLECSSNSPCRPFDQDWNYLVGKCLDLTVEMNDLKWPRPGELKRLFQVIPPPVVSPATRLST
eukprot:4688936-Pyramimonas_sp.AAC.1